MEQRRINPWEWQTQFGFSQALEISGGARILFCAGQTSVDEQGQVVHAGNMRAQVHQALDNLESVLQAGGFTLSDVVRLNYYTTDVDGLIGVYDAVTSRLAAASCQPSSTLLGVTRLAFPGLLIEIEATAAK